MSEHQHEWRLYDAAPSGFLPRGPECLFYCECGQFWWDTDCEKKWRALLDLSVGAIRIPREWTSSQPSTTVLDEAREAGRREVLMELAKLDPLSGVHEIGTCHFCGAALALAAAEVDATPDVERAVMLAAHAPDCLWLWAQAAAKEEA